MSAAMRGAFAGAMAALILTLGFPDSVGLWPLRLLAGWPGEVGRALGDLVVAKQLGPMVLSKATELSLSGDSAGAHTVPALLGLLFSLGAALGLLWLLGRPRWARVALLAAGLLSLVAAVWPPAAPVSAAEGAAALGCLVLAGWPTEAPRRVFLQLWAGLLVVAPLGELRGPLLSIGPAAGVVAALQAGTGVSAIVWAALACGLAGSAVYLLLRTEPTILSHDPPKVTNP